MKRKQNIVEENDSFEEILNEIREKEEKEMLFEMATANNGDQSCKDFTFPRFIVEVRNKEYFIQGKPHLHVISRQEKWDIRMSLRGEFLSIKHHGNRCSDDKFTDIERRIQKWLPMKYVKYQKISNFVHVQSMWNDLNPDKEIEIEEW